MGCCFSTSRGDHRSPNDSDNATTPLPNSRSTRENDAELSSTAPNVAQTPASRNANNTRHRSQLPLFGVSSSGNINHHVARSKTLKPPPRSESIIAPMVSSPNGEPRPASTLNLLNKARVEYFETRVTGRAEMWGVIQTVCGLVETGSCKDALAILEAAGGTCPTGILWGSQGGCYDDRGERYVVPAWCVGTPASILEESTGDISLVGTSFQDSKAERTSEDLDGGYIRDTKGKGRIIAEEGAIKGKEIKVKVRFSHTARDEVLTTGDQDLLELLAQRARQKATIPFDIKVRFVYLGHLMDHNRSLSDQAWQDGHVLSLYVFE